MLAAGNRSQAPATPAGYQAFPLSPPAAIPQPLYGQAPLTSVVTLVKKVTVIGYGGTINIQDPEEYWSETQERLAFGTGYIVEGNPTQILTAGHNLWDLHPVVDAPHRQYLEKLSTAIIAVPIQNFATLSPVQKRDFHALQQAGGQVVQAFRTIWPTPEELFEILIVAGGQRPDQSDLALLYLEEPFRRGAPGPHLHLFQHPVRAQPDPQDIHTMRAVVLGHVLLQLPQPQTLLLPRYSAFPIPAAGFGFGAGVFTIPVRGADPGFSGGPLCIPPEAVITRAGVPVGEAGKPCKDRCTCV